MRKAAPTVYFIIFLLFLIIPSAGLLVTGPSEPENGEETVLPSFYTKEEGFTPDYLSQLGRVFEERFAFRREFVTLYSNITGKLFGTSSQSGVVTGTDGWLYFSDTLGDYQRTNILNGRQLHNAVRHLELIDEYCNDNGIRFLFVIAPNKNTLYPGNMPYYCVPGRGESNRELLDMYLSETDVGFIDFGRYDTFNDPDAVYYFERDSHWNNMGAAIASNAVLSYLGIGHHDYVYDPFTAVANHTGDLEQMIYPGSVKPETDIIFERMPQFSYDAPVESNFDFRISTTGTGEGTLLMYRDSFGSALLLFMAEPFSDALFTRSNACQVNDFMSLSPDFLVIEKAERFISQLSTAPSRLPAPERSLSEESVQIAVSDLNIAEAGAYLTVTGTLPGGSYDDDSLILIACGDRCFEAYPVSNLQTGAEGFQAILEKNDISTDNIKVFIV